MTKEPLSARRTRDVIFIATVLAFGVVAWQQWLHASAFDVHDESTTGHILHWLRDGTLALVPAILAVAVGLHFVGRLDVSGARKTVVLRSLGVAGAMVVGLAPMVAVHTAIDDALGGGGLGTIATPPGAGYLTAAGSHGAESAGGLLGQVGHGLRDAAAAFPVALGLAIVAVAITSARVAEGRSVRRHDAGEVDLLPRRAAHGVGTVPAGTVMEGITKRELLKFGGAGAAALAVSASGLIVLSERRAHAAPNGEAVPWLSDSIELFINDGIIEMIDGVPVYHWGWGFRSGGVDERTALHVPGPVLWTEADETITLSVTNTLDEPHSFAIEGVVDSGPIPPGETVVLTFAAPTAGTYLYQDGLNGPVNRVLGLHGVLVVMPAGAPLLPHPSLDPNYWTFVTQWVWLFNEIDPAFNARAQANRSIDANEFASAFKPRYFTLNGRIGSLASHAETAPETVVHDRIGNPALIRIVNAGLAMHGPHFHGNHVYPLLRNATLAQPIMWKDTIRVMPEDRVDVFLPFIIPPNAVHFPPPAEGSRLLEELHGHEMEGSWPMHCHVEMSQTAGGGLYPQGLLTDWKVEF